MKLIAVLILYVVSCQAHYDWCSGSYLKQVMLKCVADNGAAYDDLDDFLINKPAKGEKGKCFRACVFLSCQYLTLDGRLYTDLPKRLGPLLNGGVSAGSQSIEQAANYCLYSAGRFHSLCDNTEAFIRCVVEKSPVRLTLHGVF